MNLEDHKNYQAHKDDPFVIFLMGILKEKLNTQIPKIWEDFIKQSGEGTDINLLLNQLPVWGLQGEEIDITLRGEALFDELCSFKLRRVLRRADSISSGFKPWPKALERILLDYGYIPSEGNMQSFTTGCALIPGDMEYIETGTIKYRVRRRIPGILATIPNEWFLANCGPDVNDANMLHQFNRDYANGFAPPPLKSSSGLNLRDFWKKIFFRTDSALWDRDKMTSSMAGVFPQTLQIRRWDDEQPAVLELIECRRSPMKSDEDVKARNAVFKFPQDRRGRLKAASIRFPVAPPDADSSVRYTANEEYYGRLEEYFGGHLFGEDSAIAKATISKALRGIYTKITDAKSYVEERKAFD